MQHHSVSLQKMLLISYLQYIIISNTFISNQKSLNQYLGNSTLTRALICSSPVKTCQAYIPKRPRFEEPISSSSGSSNGDFDGGYFPSGESAISNIRSTFKYHNFKYP